MSDQTSTPEQAAREQQTRQQEREERRQELRRLGRMLQSIVKQAREASLTGQLAGGKSVAVRQYNAILSRLTALGVASVELFPSLEESASFDEVGVAAGQLVSFIQEEDEEMDKRKWRNGGGVFEATPDHVKIVGFPGGIGELGELLREHLPDFLRSKVEAVKGAAKEEVRRVREEVREERQKVREEVRDEKQRMKEEQRKAREEMRQTRTEADEEIQLDFSPLRAEATAAAPPIPPTPPGPPTPPSPPPVFNPPAVATVYEPVATPEAPAPVDYAAQMAAVAERMRQPGLSPEELTGLANEMSRLARLQAESVATPTAVWTPADFQVH